MVVSPGTHIRSFSDFWILLERIRTRVVHYEFSEEIPERGINGVSWHVRRPYRVLLACVKDVAVSFRGTAVTSASFNLVSNLEAVSAMSDWCVCCEAANQLGREGHGVTSRFEPVPPLRWDGFMRLALVWSFRDTAHRGYKKFRLTYAGEWENKSSQSLSALSVI